MLPMGLENKMEGTQFPAGRSVMSKEEFYDLQKECLSVCSELTVVGGTVVPMPLITSAGQLVGDDIMDNTLLVLMLTVHSLIFNVSAFFEGDALKELTESFKDMKLFNASI